MVRLLFFPLLSFLVIVFISQPGLVYASEDGLSEFRIEFLKGYRFSQQGRSAEAIQHFQAIRDLDVSMRDYTLFYLGRELLRQGECPLAQETFQELVDNFPESRWIPVAEVQAESREPCPPLNPSTVEEAKFHCDELGSHKKEADCFFQSRQYTKAKDLYREFVGKERGRRRMEDLIRLSQSAARSQDFDMALWANEELQKNYPKTPAGLEAPRKRAFLYQDSGRFEEALPLLQALLKKTKSGAERRHLWERSAWCYFRLESYTNAIDAFDEALSETETPFSLYWKGRSLERLGKRKEADEIFKSLSDIYRETYYGIRAVERLRRRVGERVSMPSDWWSPLSTRFKLGRVETFSTTRRQMGRIYELTKIGFFSDASVEMRRSRIPLKISLVGDPKRIKREGDHYTFSVEHPLEESSDFPMPYADVIFSLLSDENGSKVDPYLVYALMRQESRFRENIVSPVGAIGLLQIMPWTGRRLAYKAGWENYETRWLYEPTTNIELSLQYLRDLFNFFGRWYAVVASYNAGEEPVAAWLKQRKGLPEEEFIEEIPYAETRNYVKLVYANWKAYQAIYHSK